MCFTILHKKNVFHVFTRNIVFLYYTFLHEKCIISFVFHVSLFLQQEEVTESLKEIVKEASRQKFYLDRLISVVIEESPWLLDQVDADFDDNSLVSQHEEFC